MTDYVVFYSLTGKSRETAERLARAIDAKLVEIVEVQPKKPGFRGFVEWGARFAVPTTARDQEHAWARDQRSRHPVRADLGGPRRGADPHLAHGARQADETIRMGA